MAAFTAAWAGTGTGFELQTRQLPELQGRDGRWDMPHMWLYPLLSVPFVWVARLAGAGDPWGLVGLNVSMVAGLLWLAARRGAGPWTLTLFASPLVWWLDKPLADLLIACAARRRDAAVAAYAGQPRAARPGRGAEPGAAGRAVSSSPSARRRADPSPPALASAGMLAAAVGRRLRGAWRRSTTSSRLGRLSPLTSYDRRLLADR